MAKPITDAAFPGEDDREWRAGRLHWRTGAAGEFLAAQKKWRARRKTPHAWTDAGQEMLSWIDRSERRVVASPARSQRVSAVVVPKESPAVDGAGQVLAVKISCQHSANSSAAVSFPEFLHQLTREFDSPFRPMNGIVAGIRPVEAAMAATLQDAISEMVERSRANGSVLNVAEAAVRLARDYGADIQDVAARITEAGVEARINMRMGVPKRVMH